MTYTCACCGEEFVSDWGEEEARTDYEATFGRPFDPQETETVCDDCYAMLMAGPPRTCSAGSILGTPCEREAMPGNRYCRQHLEANGMTDEMIPSTDDRRVENTRYWSELEKKQTQAVKDAGQLMLDLIAGLTPSVPSEKGRCLALGKTKVEEAVMWIVKGITL